MLSRVKLPFGIKLKTSGLAPFRRLVHIQRLLVYNKRVLNAFPYPGICTLSTSVGTLCMAVIWGLRLKKAPKIKTTTLVAVPPLGALHSWFAFTNASLGSVAVSFTHTIKALEPLTAIFSAIILGAIPRISMPPSCQLCPG